MRNSSFSALRMLCLVASLALLPGCARLTLMTADDLPSEIDQAIEAGDYRLAEYLISHAGSGHPDIDAINARTSRLEEAMARFQKKAREEAIQYANQQDWHSARQTLAQAEKKLPAQTGGVSQAQEELAARERSSFESVEARILLNEARWIIRHEDDARLLENYTLREAARLADMLADRRQALAERLGRLAEAPCAEEQWQRCHDLLSAQKELDADQPPDPRLEQASAHLTDAANRQRQKQARRLLREAREMKSQYESSGELEDLLALRRYVDNHNRYGVLDEIAGETARLCVERFDEGLRQGEALYARGDYQQALDAWLAIQPLFPNNSELEKKLERVYRVLDNLKKLGSGQGA